MKSFDSLGPKTAKEESKSITLDVAEIRDVFKRKRSIKPAAYYFYRSAQIVLSVWIITIAVIMAGPWLDYYVKSSINGQVLGDTAVTLSDGSHPEAPTGAEGSASDSSQAQNDRNGTFSLKNSKIEINAPIVEGIDEEALKQGIGHHPDSTWFGEKGNVVLAGHNVDLNAENPYGKVFLKLRDVSVDDQVIINFHGKNYYYKIFKSQTISPKDTSLFGQVDDWILTFYTCDPPYTDWKRLVYQAKLDKVE